MSSPQVKHSGYENCAGDFCAPQKKPVPSPLTLFPVQLLVLPGLFLCSKKIQIDLEEAGFLGLELELIKAREPGRAKEK